jgi:hypothetical protein
MNRTCADINAIEFKHELATTKSGIRVQGFGQAAGDLFADGPLAVLHFRDVVRLEICLGCEFFPGHVLANAQAAQYPAGMTVREDFRGVEKLVAFGMGFSLQISCQSFQCLAFNLGRSTFFFEKGVKDEPAAALLIISLPLSFISLRNTFHFCSYRGRPKGQALALNTNT